jgi:hypothetical protein
MNFKDFIKILNIRDDLLNGNITLEEALRKMPDEQFRTLVLTVAEMMKTVRDEAVRRGIWESFKGVKVGKE